jgi:hypothetical protein
MFAQGKARLWGRMPAHQKLKEGKFEGCGRKESLKKYGMFQRQGFGATKNAGFPASFCMP